ncbi:NADH-quinone oxidoreductase subunit A [Chloroflexota bacterium]
MLANYSYIGLFFVVAILFTLTMLLIPVALRFLNIVIKKPSPVKNSTFECGLETIGKTWVQFNFHYYFYALVFLVLDILVVFLYPWAVDLRQLGYFGLIGVLILISIVFVGYIYAWKKKVLEWK